MAENLHLFENLLPGRRIAPSYYFDVSCHYPKLLKDNWIDFALVRGMIQARLRVGCFSVKSKVLAV